MFTINSKDGKARTGVIKTKHGSFETPVFIPVATAATVKALSNKDLLDIGGSVLLANTYHLHLRPGEELIKRLGGLHKFMGWDKPLVTDSGGFQVFSLGFGMEHNVGKVADNYFINEKKINKKSPLNKNTNILKNNKNIGQKWAHIDDSGVSFRNPVTGDKVRLTPKSSMEIQSKLGADIIFAFDECTSPLSDKKYTSIALERTHRWALECLKYYDKKQALFGIVQGGAYKDLRVKSAKFISKLDFPGFGIGGSLGKSKEDMHKILGWVMPLLPENKPRHLLGIGAVEDLFNSVERGIDMFDCVGPTRWARRGHLYISPSSGGNIKNKFRINIQNTQFREDKKPIDKECDCYCCRNFSRAYLRHLYMASELSYFHLASLHNLRFILGLMERIRGSIKEKKFRMLKKQWF